MGGFLSGLMGPVTDKLQEVHKQNQAKEDQLRKIDTDMIVQATQNPNITPEEAQVLHDKLTKIYGKSKPGKEILGKVKTVLDKIQGHTQPQGSGQQNAGAAQSLPGPQGSGTPPPAQSSSPAEASANPAAAQKLPAPSPQPEAPQQASSKLKPPGFDYGGMLAKSARVPGQVAEQAEGRKRETERIKLEQESKNRKEYLDYEIKAKQAAAEHEDAKSIADREKLADKYIGPDSPENHEKRADFILNGKLPEPKAPLRPSAVTEKHEQLVRDFLLSGQAKTEDDAKKLAADAEIKKAEGTEKRDTGELGTRERAGEILADPKADPVKKKAARDTLKALDTKQAAAIVRIENLKQGQDDSQVSDDDLRSAAQAEIVQGPSARPSFGLGKSKIRNRYIHILAQERAKDPDFLSAQASYKAGSANLSSLTKLKGTIGAFEEAFQADLKNARDASAKVPRTQAKLVNKYEQLFQKDLTDYPELAEFAVYAQTVVNQYARLVSSATGGGVSTDTARGEALAILNSGMAKGSFDAALKAMETEAKNRVAGIDKQIETQKKGLSGSRKVLPGPEGSKASDPLGIR